MILIGLLITLIIALAALYVAYKLAIAAKKSKEDIAVLKSKIEALEARIAALEG